MSKTDAYLWHDEAKRNSSRPQLFLHESVVRASSELLRSTAGFFNAHESVLYWAGFEMRDKWLVSTCIRPEVFATRTSFRTSAEANARVVTFLAMHGLALLAQVHTHPGAFIDHSEGDDQGAFMAFENFISVVIPHYGRQGILPLNQCGVHRFEAGQFKRLSVSEVDRTFHVLPLARDFVERQ